MTVMLLKRCKSIIFPAEFENGLKERKENIMPSCELCDETIEIKKI